VRASGGFKIDSDIELPPVSYPSRKTRYPFNQMKVGQSFFEPCPNKSREGVRNKILSSARRIGLQGHFTTRVREPEDEPDYGVKGVRCWRIEPKK
jgi:hypothetical protein